MINRNSVSAAAVAAGLEVALAGRTTSSTPEPDFLVIGLPGELPMRSKVQISLDGGFEILERLCAALAPVEAVLEVVEVGRGEYPPSGYQIFNDPMIPASWDGTQPQPVGVRAILREKGGADSK